MERDWPRLAKAIKQAREAAGMTQRDLAVAAGISVGSVQNLEAGADRSRIPQSLAKVEVALGWTAGSGVAILEGAHPTPAGRGSTEPRKPTANLPLRIVDELESGGPLLDATVIRLPGAGDARMTVVVRGNPDATPEQIQEALLAWREAERRLRQAEGDE
jgi:transcriptional regulator with XRE-family HTH domain